MVAATARFIPQFMTIKNYIDYGFIGDVFLARGQYIHDISPYFKSTPWRLTDPQDLMLGGGIHPFDLLRWYMGDVDEVFSYSIKGGITKEYPLDDNFIVSLKFKSKAIAQVSVFTGIIDPPEPSILPVIDINLFGKYGTVVGNFSEGEKGFLKVVSKKFDVIPTQEINFAADKEGEIHKVGSHEKSLILYFEKCIKEDINPVLSVIEGAKDVAVGVAAWESIRKNKPIKVKNDF